jgi:hypothetical protein
MRLRPVDEQQRVVAGDDRGRRPRLEGAFEVLQRL